MRTLIFCPLGPKPPLGSMNATPRVWGRSLTSIFRQYSDGEINYLFREGPNDKAEKNENVLEQYQFARQLVLDEGFDALLTVESDMILPPDALIKLTGHLLQGAEIAYGLYVFRHGLKRWSAYTEIRTTHGTSISEDPEFAKASWGKVIEVQGVGHGCTLISRSALEQVEMRLLPGTPWAVAPDWMMANDARIAGLRQVCDLSVVCGHMEYKPWPRIIWPDPEADMLYSIEPVPDPVTGKLPIRELKPGESVEISAGMGTVEIFKVRDNGKLVG